MSFKAMHELAVIALQLNLRTLSLPHSLLFSYRVSFQFLSDIKPFSCLRTFALAVPLLRTLSP